MPHASPLISTIVVGIGLAFVLGALAARLKVSPLVGYLLAGIVVGPYSPGFVADQTLAPQLAEIGVVLLMFGVGLHFSWKDLLSVARVAVPGALSQMVVATALGTALALAMGWTLGQGVVFGLALSVASTVVLLRALQERHILDCERGRIAVGWLVVEDIAMVLVLVLLPVVADSLGGKAPASAGGWLAETLGLGFGGVLALTLGKVVAFALLMMGVGRRVIPWLLHTVVHMGSRELFRLAVLTIALTVAFGAAELFGVSLALGAFFAGMVLSESELSQRAAEETLPLRDAFAVLFFVSVGMLFDPSALLRDPGSILGVLMIVMVVNGLVAHAVISRLGYAPETAWMLAAGVGQIGEFSFILMDLAVRLEVLPERARDLILAGAMLSILLNPVLFLAVERVLSRREKDSPSVVSEVAPRVLVPRTTLSGHVVVIGGGAVGSRVLELLKIRGLPLLVIEESDIKVERLRGEGVEVILGNAADPNVLAAANLEAARQLVVAIPQAFEAGQVVKQARTTNPRLEILSRAYSDVETERLQELGADIVVTGVREVANAMARYLASGEVPPVFEAEVVEDGASI
ncbi:MAG: Kef family K(+) transporter [Rhodospirillaceae bacterium]|nr:Kef family K(+) transporter [Rhodospirillaceae bacterium]